MVLFPVLSWTLRGRKRLHPSAGRFGALVLPPYGFRSGPRTTGRTPYWPLPGHDNFRGVAPY